MYENFSNNYRGKNLKLRKLNPEKYKNNKPS